MKQAEFKRDTQTEEESPLDTAFQEVREFCQEKAQSNCFLIEKDRRDEQVNALHELVDLKLLHLIRSRVTVSSRQGRVFEAYMLDLSQYAGASSPTSEGRRLKPCVPPRIPALGITPEPPRPADPTPERPLERWSAQVQTCQRIELLPGLALLLGPNPTPAVANAARAICAQYLG